MNLIIDTTTKKIEVYGSLTSGAEIPIRATRADAVALSGDYVVEVSSKSTLVAQETITATSGGLYGSINTNTTEFHDLFESLGNPESLTVRIDIYSLAGTVLGYVGSGETVAIFNTSAQVPTPIVPNNQQYGEVTLSIGIDTYNVTFATAFSSVPIVILTISKPNMLAAEIYGSVSNITVNGFKLTLGSSPSEALYKASYVAKVI